MFFPAQTQLTTLDGQPLKDNDKVLTLGTVACNALLAPFDDERTLSGEDKVMRFDLALKISKADGLPVQLKVEEAALIKKLVAKLYGALVVGQVWQAIDNPPSGPGKPNGKAKPERHPHTQENA